MAKVVTRCIFCGRTDLSREHVWSEWTHNFIRKSGSMNMKATIKRPKRGQPHKEEADIITLQLRVVCKKHCNSGWMNLLENRVRNILIPLMTNAPIALNRYNQEILATWIATKMMVAEFIAPEDTLFSSLDRSLVMGRRTPPEIMGIFIGQYKGDRRHNMYMRRGHNLIVAPRGVVPTIPSGRMQSNIQEQTFVIGELFVQTASTTVKELSLKPPNSAFFNQLKQIWPYKADFSWPLADPLFDFHVHFILNAFEKYIGGFPKARGPARI
jgi:hypothetical protein